MSRQRPTPYGPPTGAARRFVGSIRPMAMSSRPSMSCPARRAQRSATARSGSPATAPRRSSGSTPPRTRSPPRSRLTSVLTPSPSPRLGLGHEWHSSTLEDRPGDEPGRGDGGARCDISGRRRRGRAQIGVRGLPRRGRIGRSRAGRDHGRIVIDGADFYDLKLPGTELGRPMHPARPCSASTSMHLAAEFGLTKPAVAPAARCS